MLNRDLPTISMRDYPPPQLHPALGTHNAGPPEHAGPPEDGAADEEITRTASDTPKHFRGAATGE